MSYTTTKVQALKSYPTYQFYAKTGSKTVDADGVFKICILEALKWIRSRLQEHHELPHELNAPEPDDFEDFSCSELTSFSFNSGFQIDVIYIDTLGVWSFRITEPDMGANAGTPQERPAVNGRTFTTEIAFRKQEDHVEVGVRTICSEPVDTEADCEVFRPRVVRALIENSRLDISHGGLMIDGTALEIKSKSALELFFDVFFDPMRSMPIIVVAESMTETINTVTVDTMPVDPLPSNSSYSLSGFKKPESMKLTISAELKGYKTDLVRENKPKKIKTKQSAENKSKTVPKKLPAIDYNKLADDLKSYAVVVFAEERFFGNIESKTHIPVNHGDVILITHIQESERFAYESYRNDIDVFYDTFRTSVVNMSKRGTYCFGDVMFYSDAKLKEYKTKRHQTNSLEEKCDIYKLENEELKARIRELTQQQTDMSRISEALRAAQKKNDLLTKELEAKKEKYKTLNEEFRFKEDSYRKSAEKMGYYRQMIELAAGFPTDKKDVCEWAEDKFSNELIVAPRAQSEMRKYSGALDVATLCDGIVFLDAYAKYRRREISAQQLENYAERNRWEALPCGSGTLNMRRDDYTLTIGGVQYLLDMHIKHGRQAEELIRIYFCWYDEKQKIVIGSMPGHLATVKDGT